LSTDNIIERAFELAREGQCRTLDDIRRALSRERFANVNAHLAGLGIRNQLRKLMRQNRPEPIAPPAIHGHDASGTAAIHS
jgi:hypothetical protein